MKLDKSFATRGHHLFANSLTVAPSLKLPTTCSWQTELAGQSSRGSSMAILTPIWLAAWHSIFPSWPPPSTPTTVLVTPCTGWSLCLQAPHTKKKKIQSGENPAAAPTNDTEIATNSKTSREKRALTPREEEKDAWRRWRAAAIEAAAGRWAAASRRRGKGGRRRRGGGRRRRRRRGRGR